MQLERRHQDPDHDGGGDAGLQPGDTAECLSERVEPGDVPSADGPCHVSNHPPQGDDPVDRDGTGRLGSLEPALRRCQMFPDRRLPHGAHHRRVISLRARLLGHVEDSQQDHHVVKQGARERERIARRAAQQPLHRLETCATIFQPSEPVPPSRRPIRRHEWVVPPHPPCHLLRFRARTGGSSSAYRRYAVPNCRYVLSSRSPRAS